MVLPGFLWAKGMHKSSTRAKASPGFLESEVHVSALINCNLMMLNEVGINRKIFELAVILIALYFDPKITHTKVGRTK
jgi:hypothetical protein